MWNCILLFLFVYFTSSFVEKANHLLQCCWQLSAHNNNRHRNAEKYFKITSVAIAHFCQEFLFTSYFQSPITKTNSEELLWLKNVTTSCKPFKSCQQQFEIFVICCNEVKAKCRAFYLFHYSCLMYLFIYFYPWLSPKCRAWCLPKCCGFCALWKLV